MAELVFQDKDFPFALSMTEQLTQRQNHLNDQLGLADSSKLMGSIYFAQGLLNKAEEYLKQAISMFQRLGVIPGEAESLKAMGLCCQKQGRIPESSDFFDQARKLFKSLGNMNEYNQIHLLQNNLNVSE